MFWPATVTNVACVVGRPRCASATSSSGTLAVKSLDTDSAPLLAVLDAVAGRRCPTACSSRRLPVTVASTFADAAERLVEQLADLLEARRVGVDLQVRLPGVVQRQRAARLDVDVAADDLERADLAGRVADSRRRRRSRDDEAADRRRLERRPSRPPATLSGVTPLETFGDRRVDVERAADRALQRRLAADRRRIEAGEAAGRLDVRGVVAPALPSNVELRNRVRPGSTNRSASRCAVTSISFGVVPRPFAATWPLIELL